ncbi:alpha-2-macroglobulin family protein [Stappia indica]|uniref:alpha-2-macroglobulin family protein n=1 Tax=Stappia indica TaxID=538381 RepID=UPI001CD6979C|nr:alpha-2-macroglobulin family protein [Stappia indica]MCA1297253.1 alpha-2-macroglobulin family protein [Stappia indica]
MGADNLTKAHAPKGIGRISRVLFGAGLLSLAVLQGAGQAEERRIVTIDNADYFGSDLRTLKDVDLDACKAACVAEKSCQALTYNTSAGWCFLKSSVGELHAFKGAIAGRIVMVKAMDEATVDARRADLSFLPGNLMDEAGRYARQLPRAFTPASDGTSAFGLLAQGQSEAAERAFGRSLALEPTNYGLWAGMTRSLLRQKPDDWRRRNKVMQDGGAAAVNAYLAAATDMDRVEAYDLLASALERRQLYKPAIKALRAALALDDRADLRSRYEQLVAEHGFRILDHQVDSDAVSPRVCVVFSEELPRTRDMGPFVKATGEGPFSVESDGAQVCVDGVRHGQRYGILVRQGLPSASGEVLEKSADLSVYVRDRSPAVRFLGRAYVLPAGDGATIPLVSVNTGEVETEIYRIGERGLASALRDRRVLSQLDSYKADQIRDEYGEQVWSGTVETAQRLNQDVTTAVPLEEIGLDMKPGIYAMVARAATDQANRWGPWATQWFIVSDLGLSAYSGGDGTMVSVRALSSAQAVAGATVRLVAVNNDVLGEATSDGEGIARFPAGLSRGKGGRAPALVAVETKTGDYAFLDLTKPAFDLSDRGVEGRASPGPVDVFAWTDRGVYRPGESVHVGAMARDPGARARADLPLTLVFARPDGVEHSRAVTEDAGAGGRAYSLALPASAQQGTWTLRVYADPKAPALSETSFLVEDFQPERVDFTLEADAKAIDPLDPPEVSFTAKFLYGTPASGQRIEGEVIVSPTRENAAWPGYVFGLADEQIFPNQAILSDAGVTDEAGRGSFVPPLPDLEPTTAGYTARIVTRLVEAGGRYVERGLELPLLPDGARIGVKPAFDGGVEEGGPAEFDVIAIDREGARVAMSEVTWTLAKLDTRYQWYRSDGRWSYEPVTTSRRVASGTLDIGADGPQRVSLPVDWGRYRLEVVRDGTEPAATSTEFNAGWYVSSASSETPDVLDVGLDKPAYRVGETARLRMKPRFDGVALVHVVNEKLIETRALPVKAGEADVELTVTDDWGVGAYVTATLLRPMDIAAKRMPARALGLQWLKVDPGARVHTVSLEAPEQMLPRTTLDVDVRIAGQGAGETAYLTLAAVDVGILNLTRFETPDPDGWYFGQRRLATEIRDYYGQLIDRTAGELGRVRSGGDGMGLSLAAPPPQEAPVALFSGVVETDAEGRATVSFDVPDFNGTLRLMAVAWSAGGVGHSERDVTVRDPVVMTATLPRFLAPGDASRLLVEIDNVDGGAGDYRIHVDVDGPVSVDLPDSGRGLTLAKGERQSLRLPLRAGGTPGDASLHLTISGPGGEIAEKRLALGVRDNTPLVTRRSFVTLAPGGALTLDGGSLSGLKPETASLTLAAGGAARIDIPGLLAALDRYPYGCTEQTTSRALPLLYLNEMASAAGLKSDDEIAARVDKAIAAVLANQSSNGAFGLWSSYGSQDPWLDAYVTDFLIRAGETGHIVPAQALSGALDNLENRVAYASDFRDGGEGIAYALNVLARAGRASVGDLRYYADVKLNDFGSALARAQLGGALAGYGEKQRARQAFQSALASIPAGDGTGYREDYGTALRDAAGVLTYVTKAGLDGVDAAGLTRQVADRQDRTSALSTQDMAWLLLAGHELQVNAEADRFAINGDALAGRLVRKVGGNALMRENLRVENRGDTGSDVVVTVSGQPVVPEPAGGRGYTITRQLFDLDGKPLEGGVVAQNTRVAVVLTVTADRPGKGRMLVVDRLPAGLTIDNPRLVRSGDIGALDWLSTIDSADHVEFRDDRFVVALDQSGQNTDSYTFAYLARASIPGEFAHPPATVEDMYRPDLAATTATGRFEVLGPQR